MTPYLFTFLMLAILSLSQHSRHFIKYKFLFFLFVTFYLILFAGLRNLGVGDDDFGYYDFYTFKTPNLFNWVFGDYVYDIKEFYMEPGYVFLNSLLRVFTDNYSVLFLTVAFISVGLASYNYLRYSKYVFLTLLLFFVHTYLYRDMNQIRSGVAAAIGLFLISQIFYKKHLKVFISLYLMSLFHMASLCLIAGYIFSYFSVTKRRVIVVYILSVFMGMFGISHIVFGLIPGGGILEIKLLDYLNNDSYLEAVSLFDITNIKNSVILLMVIIFWDKLERMVPYFKIVVLFYLMSTSIRIAFWDLGVVAARTATFFGIVEVILIPYFVSLFRHKILPNMLIISYGFMVLYINLFVKEGRYPYNLSIF